MRGDWPTIVEVDGTWWWADETWTWHGPCSTRESAVRRQNMYCSWLLCPDRDYSVPVDELAWEQAKAAEKENVVHPCHCAAPWDCECVGACSCHWKEGK